MKAPILRRHRKATIAAWFKRPLHMSEEETDALEHWCRTGEGGMYSTRFEDMSQAIADAELARDMRAATKVLDGGNAALLASVCGVSVDDIVTWNEEDIAALLLSGSKWREP